MFTSWLHASTTPLAFSSTTDVRQSPPVPKDNMESFVVRPHAPSSSLLNPA